MKFEEYLAAAGDADLVELLQAWVVGTPFAEIAHRRLLERLRDYLMVGGMPEAVSTYVGSQDVGACCEVQNAILETYRDDFPKYGRRGDSGVVHKVYDYVPRHVGEKIKYANIDRHVQARTLRGVIDLLFQARVAFPVYRSTASGVPLGSGVDERVVKPYFLDCGLVARATGVEWFDTATLASPSFVNAGKLAEQFVAQHLLYGGAPDTRPQLYYWLREGRSNNAEVDFLTELGSSLAPVEVKSGKSGTMKSLFQYAALRDARFASRFDTNPPSVTTPGHNLPGHNLPGRGRVELRLLSLPLYLVQQYRRLAASS
jgi:predicted AAA+ superfamily ATPase